jgi:DNA-binding SARP family transcriptional activator
MTITFERPVLATGVGSGASERSAPPVVEISVLGGFRIVIGGRDVTAAIGRRDAHRLAKLLALSPSRRLHREQLIDALWPQAPLDGAANRLYKAAHYLRRATGLADGVVLSDATVALLPHADVEVDARVFDRLATDGLATGDAATIDRAIAVYSGDLLPLDPYEEWLEHDRHRLRGRMRELLRARGRFDRMVALDPTDEQGHVGIMRAMVRDGDRSGVLRQYDRLRRVLDEELGVDPGPEARALRDLALNAPAPERGRLLPRFDPAAYRTAGRTRCTGFRRSTVRHGGNSR